MGWSLKPSNKAAFMGKLTEVQWLRGPVKQMAAADPKLRTKGGNWLWLGGELLVKNSQVIWSHKMKTHSDRPEAKLIRRILGGEP